MNEWESARERFLEDCRDAVRISRENLRRLMEDNKDTEYGRRHGFAAIRDAEEYQRQVPLSDYRDYEEEVARMEQGEERVLTAYEVKHYIMTSGSTGRQKRIPLTKEALGRCIFPIYYAAYACIPGMDAGKYLHLSVFRMEPPVPERDTILSAAYFRELYDRESFQLEERYLGGTRLLFSKGMGDVPYGKLWVMLSSPEMAGIQAFFLYDILLFFRYFEENWRRVLEDITYRRIPREAPLSDSVREALLALPVPQEGWLERVERECAAVFAGILGRLWPGVKFVSGVGGSTFAAQEPMLRAYLGEVPVHYFTYAASECMMAITMRLESKENVLMPRSGFYEFIPYEKEGDGRPRTIEELETGERSAFVDYKTMLQEIIQKNHTLETIFTTMECGVMTHSVDGSRILSVNRAALEILGYRSEAELIADGFDLIASSVLDEDKPKLREAILSLSREDVARAVVGAIGDMDAYMLPGAKGSTAMWRNLCGDTEEIRARIREEALGTTLKDFHDFAPWLARVLTKATPCALGGSDVEKAANAAGWTLKKLL